MLNTIQLIGRITKEPELRKTQNGLSVCSFTLAVNRDYKKDGEQEADFINCIAWKNQAEFIHSYIHKGNLMSVKGRLQTRTYEDSKGSKIHVTEVVCESVYQLEKKQVVNTQPHYASEPVNDYASDNIEISSDDLPF